MPKVTFTEEALTRITVSIKDAHELYDVFSNDFLRFLRIEIPNYQAFGHEYITGKYVGLFTLGDAKKIETWLLEHGAEYVSQ